jgi:prolipoprotein diacylglyceryltransferase
MFYPEGKSSEVAAGLRHNLGFYEFFWALAMSAWFFTQRNKPKWAGWYLTMYLLFYCPLRFAWDFFRVVDEVYFETDTFPGLTPGQIAAIGLWGLSLWLWKTRRHAELLVPDGQIHVFPDGTPAIVAEATASAGPSRGPAKKTAKSRKKKG